MCRTSPPPQIVQVPYTCRCYLPALPCICICCLCFCTSENQPLGYLWTSHISMPFTSHFCPFLNNPSACWLFLYRFLSILQNCFKSFFISSCMVHVTLGIPLPTFFPVPWISHLLYPPHNRNLCASCTPLICFFALFLLVQKINFFTTLNLLCKKKTTLSFEFLLSALYQCQNWNLCPHYTIMDKFVVIINLNNRLA